MKRVWAALIALGVMFVAASGVTLIAQTPIVIFNVGWESSTVGCDRDQFRHANGGATNSWADDWAGWATNATFCTPNPPWGEIISSHVWNGTRAFRKWYADPSIHDPGDGGGPEITMHKPISPTQELFFRQHTYFSPTFLVQYDLKNIIVLNDSAQDIYLQFRPGGGTAGRLNVHLGTNVQVASNAAGNINQDTWHCIEWHVRAGTGGTALVEAKINNNLVTWDGGATSITGSTSGNSFNDWKYETYHNGYLGQLQNLPYYRDDDDWQVCTNTWCGCAPQGGGQPAPPRPPLPMFRLRR